MPDAIEVLKQLKTENRPLDQQGLEQAWAEMLAQQPEELEKVRDRIVDLKPQLTDPDNFTLIVGNNFVATAVRESRMPMLSILRKLTGRPLLNCHIEVVYEEKETVAYAPRDKYDVMVKANPVLDTFRVLFPDVDY